MMRVSRTSAPCHVSPFNLVLTAEHDVSSRKSQKHVGMMREIGAEQNAPVTGTTLSNLGIKSAKPRARPQRITIKIQRLTRCRAGVSLMDTSLVHQSRKGSQRVSKTEFVAILADTVPGRMIVRLPTTQAAILNASTAEVSIGDSASDPTTRWKYIVTRSVRQMLTDVAHLFARGK